MPLRLIWLSGTAGYYYCFYLSSCFICLQRYKEFLKLPNKMHFNYYFRCIFNLYFIFKENSQHLFHLLFFFCRPPGNRTLRNLDCLAIRWLLPVVGEFRLLLSIANHRTACVKLKHADASAVKHLNFKVMFKITYPVAVSLHACRSAGRGRGRLSGFPLYE